MSGLITFDADHSPADFFRSLGCKSREELYAEHLEHVIRLIEVGHDLYGIPPLMVADARRLMAEREEQLTECRGDPLLGRVR